MYRGVIFTLGPTTAEKELDSIRNGKSRILQYFDSVKEVNPINGLNSYVPKKMPDPKRSLNMRPVEGRIGKDYLLIVPVMAGAFERDGGSIVDRRGYFEIADKLVGLGLCRLHTLDYEHGDIVFPERVDNSDSLRKMWGEEYYSGFPDQELMDALYQKCLGSGLTVVKLPLTLSVLNLEESNRYTDRELLDRGYGARETEMAWFLAHARKLGKPTAGALAISDREGETFDSYVAYHKIPEKTHEGVSKLLESAVQLFVE